MGRSCCGWRAKKDFGRYSLKVSRGAAVNVHTDYTETLRERWENPIIMNKLYSY